MVFVLGSQKQKRSFPSFLSVCIRGSIMYRVGVLLVVLSVLITGCGMSDEEKLDLAKVTCSIIRETRSVDSALRVKEMNLARERLGKPVYLDGGYGINQSLKWGLCEELVLNDPSYETQLQSLIVAERERQEESRRRIEEEKKRFIDAKIAEMRAGTGRHVIQSEDGWKIGFDLDSRMFSYGGNKEMNVDEFRYPMHDLKVSDSGIVWVNPDPVPTSRKNTWEINLQSGVQQRSQYLPLWPGQTRKEFEDYSIIE